jgi:hypothetical protein
MTGVPARNSGLLSQPCHERLSALTQYSLGQPQKQLKVRLHHMCNSATAKKKNSRRGKM